MLKKVLPTIIICGGTGTGKSKLGIELAKYFNGEVINADAIQVYKGLDIATNKVTQEEADGVKHHILGVIEPNVLDYCVHEFRKTALSIIENLKENNKMPIVVGGTSYYLESLLHSNLVPVKSYDQELAMNKTEADHPLNKGIDMSDIELHNWLCELDPKTAAVIHPKDRRKVWRALEIIINGGKAQSKYLEDQDQSRRFGLSELILFWLHADESQLEPRLDKRVDEMMDRGLLNELNEIQELFLKYRPNDKYTKGIFQAIGFKEFKRYINEKVNKPDISEESLAPIIDECVNNLKTAHKRYVKSQNKDILRRFLRPNYDNSSYPVYKLDASYVDQWDQNVLEKAIKIINQTTEITSTTNSYKEFISLLPIKPTPPNDAFQKPTVCHRTCEYCDGKIFVSEEQWLDHIRSKRHYKTVRNLKRRQAWMKNMKDNNPQSENMPCEDTEHDSSEKSVKFC